MPILSVGALTGSILGIIAVHFGLPPENIPAFAVCAMAGALSASVKAPVTSILLAAEMTGSLIHLLPVAACSFIAMYFSDILRITPIYEALLARIMDKKEDVIRNDRMGGLLEIPVETGSLAAGKLVSEVKWPAGALIVSIRRGNEELVPKGGTKIIPGDYLTVMSSEQTYEDIHSDLRKLCHVHEE